jgi:hypothetical protein
VERKLLNSWKEISSYLGRGVRTVQRYEIQFALPVHRPAGVSRSSVIAFSDELDRWLEQSPTRSQQKDSEKEVAVLRTTIPIRERAGQEHDLNGVCPLCLGTGKAPTPRTATDRPHSLLAPQKQVKSISA